MLLIGSGGLNACLNSLPAKMCWTIVMYMYFKKLFWDLKAREWDVFVGPMTPVDSDVEDSQNSCRAGEAAGYDQEERHLSTIRV